MNLNRTIKLTPQIRQEMADAVQAAWLRKNPRPRMPVVPTGPQLTALTKWREGQEDIRRRFMNALNTFQSVNQLAELWPKALDFVPGYLVDPEKHFDLPEAA